MVGQSRRHIAIARANVGSFGSLFQVGRMSRLQKLMRCRCRLVTAAPETKPTGEESDIDMNPNDGVSAEEVGGLLDKVRMLQQQFNETKADRAVTCVHRCYVDTLCYSF